MRDAKISMHIRFSQTQLNILDNLIETKSGINSYSEAVRYAVMSLEIPEDTAGMQRKINAMSKELSIAVEMLAGGFHESNVKDIGQKEECPIYRTAKKYVEENIQRATTYKSTHAPKKFK